MIVAERKHGVAAAEQGHVCGADRTGLDRQRLGVDAEQADAARGGGLLDVVGIGHFAAQHAAGSDRGVAAQTSVPPEASRSSARRPSSCSTAITTSACGETGDQTCLPKRTVEHAAATWAMP